MTPLMRLLRLVALLGATVLALAGIGEPVEEADRGNTASRAEWRPGLPPAKHYATDRRASPIHDRRPVRPLAPPPPGASDRADGQSLQGDAAHHLPERAECPRPLASRVGDGPPRADDQALRRRVGDPGPGHGGRGADQATARKAHMEDFSYHSGLGAQPDEPARPGQVLPAARAYLPERHEGYAKDLLARHRPVAALGRRPGRPEGMEALLQGRLGRRQRASESPDGPVRARPLPRGALDHDGEQP